MKKLIAIFLSLLLFTGFAVAVIATPSTILYLLNWGEYIDHSLITDFEQKYHCQVIEETVTSSEAMYQKITSRTTSYDVAIPGDYTVHQLYDEGYLKPLSVHDDELSSLKNHKTIFTDDLSQLMSHYMRDKKTGKEFDDYFMPYFWGAYVMLYSTEKPDVESVVKKNGFEALYDRSLYQESVNLGMYDTSRWIVASYLLAKGYDPNLISYDGKKEGDMSTKMKSDIIAALKQTRFNEFGNDSLKRDVANGKKDVVFTQLGDFFDALFLVYNNASGPIDIHFNVNVPKTTAAFFDSMVIPTTAQNETLANKFINFMLTPENAYRNATAIGYCPTLKKVADLYRENAQKGEFYYQDEYNSLTLKDFLDHYPMYLDPLSGSDTYYLLEPKSNVYLTTCDTIFNSLA